MAKKPTSNFTHSMSCGDSTAISERRRNLKKQYSEDWFIDDRKSTLIDLNNKPSVLVKKFQVEKNKARGKMMMSRHSSLEKESILSSNNKKETKASSSELLTLNNNNKNKPNLEIYLNNTSQEILATENQEVELDLLERNQIKPKCLQRLSLTNNYQIKKISSSKNKQITVKPNNTILVIPIIKETPPPPPPSDETIINVLVQNRREHHLLTKKSPLIRSSSAPTLFKTDKGGKFLATKKKVKKPCCTNNKTHHQTSSSEWNNNASVQTQQSSEIVTMISLISDNEEESNDDNDERIKSSRPKSALKKELDEELNKTIKSVSFNHHSGRSFSASFPTRRRGSLSTTANIPGHDDNKNNSTDKYYLEEENDENLILISPTTRQNQRNNTFKENTQQKMNNDNDGNKEKQCWEMYRKITEKGIGISYDTILRGMLTPTEYRIQKKTSLVKEFTLL